jgi:hypothetical protein
MYADVSRGRVPAERGSIRYLTPLFKNWLVKALLAVTGPEMSLLELSQWE